MPDYLEKSEIQRLAAELLGREISDFAVDFIYGMKATEELIRVAHAKLTGFGLTDEKIATSAALLGLNPETIQRNYENLRGIGLSDEKIATLAQLLNRDPETIQRNYENLRRIGLSNEKIAQQAALLSRDPETIQRNYENLRRIGLSDEKIATNAALLSRDPETIQRNYDHHIGMLGGRGSGKSILTSQAQLLSRPPGTDDNGSKKSLASGGFAGTFQYLAYIDRMSGNGHAPTHRRNPMLLGTTPTNKREKIAWLLREVYDYRKLGPDEKKSAIKRVYRLVSDEPKLLLYSISTLKMRKDAIRQKVT
jgi:DNA-binding transcriptional regulator YhcF (GntR family)